MKPRSNREQVAEFSITRPRSAPILIRQLIQFNETLTKHARPSDKDKLFLACANGRSTLPSIQTFHNALAKFIQRHNLPNFDFKQFRTASIVFHFEESNDIQIARKKANHAHVRTTWTYLSQGVKQKNDRLIQKFQGELVKMSSIKTGTNPVSKKNPVFSQDESLYADTIFGFGCKDPLAGVADGSTPGKLCTQFNSCATCPGAIVVLDNPDVVAKLIKSANELKITRERALSEGWLPRFNMLYAGVLEIIEKDLLSKCGPLMLEKAESRASIINFPVIE
jgi:hypothetical protein